MPDVPFLYLLTSFGDQSLILPFAGAVCVTLWLGGAKRESRIWVLAIGTALATTLALKLCFLPCGHLIPQWQLRSPSGHAAAAFAAYGGFAVLESRLRTVRWQRVLILGSGLTFAAFVAGSRVALHAHTLPEVLLGSAVGLTAPLILLWKIKAFSRGAVAKPLLLALLLPMILLIAFHGETLPVEGLIASVALSVAQTLGICA